MVEVMCYECGKVFGENEIQIEEGIEYCPFCCGDVLINVVDAVMDIEG